jgi:hypothetical protein
MAPQEIKLLAKITGPSKTTGFIKKGLASTNQFVLGQKKVPAIIYGPFNNFFRNLCRTVECPDFQVSISLESLQLR